MYELSKRSSNAPVDRHTGFRGSRKPAKALALVCVFTVALLLLAVLSKSRAEDTVEGSSGTDDFASLSIEELMEIEVVVAASGFEQHTGDAPSSITIITADEIKYQGYRTLADILRSVKGLFTTYDRHYEYVGVRGFGRLGDYNTRVLLLVDGHRINDNIYEMSYVGSDFPLDVDMIQRVEIVRGPSSSLHGTSAFFGVINVVVKKGHDIEGAWLSGDGGSFSAYGGRFVYGDALDNGLEMVVAGSHFNRDGEQLYYEEFDHPKTNNGIVETGRDDDRSERMYAALSYGDFTLCGVYW